jgi:hypothetical protein
VFRIAIHFIRAVGYLAVNIARLMSGLLVACACMAARADDAVFNHPATGRTLLDTVLVEPSRALAKTQVLQGRFTHRKYLTELPQPLTASGEFTLGRELGVYWHTRQPFDSLFVLTPQGMTQRDEGTETLRLNADQPAVRVVGTIFLALFTLDVTTLSQSFELYGHKPNEKWVVGLKPKSSAVANVFKQAVVSGQRNVEQVTLTDQHGDRTVIDLHAVVHSSEVTPAVRALFKR